MNDRWCGIIVSVSYARSNNMDRRKNICQFGERLLRMGCISDENYLSTIGIPSVSVRDWNTYDMSLISIGWVQSQKSLACKNIFCDT